jgi:hypothetical protein
MRKTTADRIRTGDVITNVWAQSTGKAIEVAYPIRDTFTNPEGARLPRVRFAGWERSLYRPEYVGRWVEAGFGVRPDERVYVITEAADTPRPYQEAYPRTDVDGYDADDRCEHCGEHIADPHAPDCPDAD